MLGKEHRCEELEASSGQFHEKFDEMATYKSEIVAFWKKEVEQKSRTLIYLPQVMTKGLQ